MILYDRMKRFLLLSEDERDAPQDAICFAYSFGDLLKSAQLATVALKYILIK